MESAPKKALELSKEQEYVVGNASFIVTPIFREDGEQTIVAALLRLMKREIDH